MILLLLPAPILLAQFIGQSGLPGDPSIVDLLTGLGITGVSGVFVWLYLTERKEHRQDVAEFNKERKEYQDKILVMTKELVPIVHDATATLERVQNGLVAQVQRKDEDSGVHTAVKRFEKVAENLLEELSKKGQA